MVCTTTPIFPHLRHYFRLIFRQTKLADNSTLRFRLYDLSLGGMGALLEQQARPLIRGMRFAQIEVNMGNGAFFTLTPSYSDSAQQSY